MKHPSAWATVAILALLVCGIVLLPARTAAAAPEPTASTHASILVIDLEGEVDPIMKAYLLRRLERAKDEGMDCIVLRIDSFGGHLFAGKEMADALLEMPASIRIVAWVPNKAISAAAFIALACDEVQLAPGATIGDCQPILTAAGSGGYEEAGEKIESPLRAWFRRCAKANGYPVLLAEAMVSKHLEVVRVRKATGQATYYLEGPDLRAAKDDDVLLPEELPGVRRSQLVQVGGPIVQEGELLTLTAEEALELGFVNRRFGDRLPADEQALLDILKAPGARVAFTAPTFSEVSGRFLYGLTGILSALVALAIMLFLWQGPGLMTIVGGAALALLLLISATADHLHGFPLFLMGLGVLLMAVEVFLIPGFGLPGILGLASLAAGMLFLATGASPVQPGPLEGGALVKFGLQFVATILAGFAGVMLLSRTLPRFGPGRAMILTAPTGTSRAEPGHMANLEVGAVGRALTPLRPAGAARFGKATQDVFSEGEWIETGTPVQIVTIEGEHVTVRALATEEPA